MPYIKEERRTSLDFSIGNAVEVIKSNIEKSYNKNISNQELLELSGDINYFVSRLISQISGEISYSKICIITGVLENIKQEFYRRVAVAYENKKINENGDIKEYKNAN